MTIRKAFIITLGLFLAFTVALPLANADEANQATRFTFTQPVRIPGQILPAGTYWFVLIDHGSDRNVVQIFNSDRSNLITTVQTVDVEHLNPSGLPEVTLAEPEQPVESSEEPATLTTWFYPGLIDGHEFIYSPQLEKTLGGEKRVTIMVDSSESIARTEVKGD